MDSYNAVRIRSCRRNDSRSVSTTWESPPVAISRARNESYEAAANRALASAHMVLDGKFRERHTRRNDEDQARRGPAVPIANSRIPAYQAWLEAVLVDVPNEECLAGPVSATDLHRSSAAAA